MAQDRNQPERPRVEPEIIPPDRGGREAPWRHDIWGRDGAGRTYGTRSIYVGRLGPLGTMLLMLLVGVLAAVVLLAVLGAVLIWMPLVALILIAGALFRVLRR